MHVRGMGTFFVNMVVVEANNIRSPGVRGLLSLANRRKVDLAKVVSAWEKWSVIVSLVMARHSSCWNDS